MSGIAPGCLRFRLFCVAAQLDGLSLRSAHQELMVSRCDLLLESSSLLAALPLRQGTHKRDR